MRRIREEHDCVFDPDIDTTVEMLATSPSKTNELEYTTAVIKETLRIFPPGFAIRKSPDDRLVQDIYSHCFTGFLDFLYRLSL
jgi:cytochrome P450